MQVCLGPHVTGFVQKCAVLFLGKLTHYLLYLLWEAFLLPQDWVMTHL